MYDALSITVSNIDKKMITLSYVVKEHITMITQTHHSICK